jgi:hypothetical protein
MNKNDALYYEKLLKLHLINPKECTFPEWEFCEKIMKKYKKIRFNTKVDNMYYYNSKKKSYLDRLYDSL